MDKIKVLFVCTGNICRSPTAEGVLRHRVRNAGLHERVDIDSAGTHGWHAGDPPDPRAIRQAKRRGYDLSDLRARTLEVEDFHAFDLILAMDEGHLQLMSHMAPEGAQAELTLFMDFATEPGAPREVPDPYYGDTADYDHALDLIEQGVEGLLGRLQQSRE